jgi:ADP-ribosylglycohydrolase
MKKVVWVLTVCWGGLCFAEERVISEAALLDKISGFWIGQLVGNYMGFPFESLYEEEPIPFLVDRYYTYRDDAAIRLHRDDLRGFVPIVAGYVEGAFSDDDTDIELVTLHAVEEHGLDITYDEITEAWKRHINRRIWVANRSARNLMAQGFVAPDTGRKENNPNWFQIDPQLVNEIWSAFYPGMVAQAVERAEWGARITNDDWGVHPTMAYGAMISAAFFETDADKLVRIGMDAVPKRSPFADGLRDLVAWHKKHEDWRETRRLMHEKYYAYRYEGEDLPVSIISSLINGLAGVLAILYGDGDFLKTVGIATSAGYDCDNQAATCGGLLGVMHGLGGIPEHLTTDVSFEGRWDKPFNDQYVNVSRDDLPIVTRISALTSRTAAIAQRAIMANGGHKEMRDGTAVFVIAVP